MRELVFGPMPAGATPVTHKAAGVWCFAEQEDDCFPGWDGPDGFILPPDPYPSAAFMRTEALAANAEAVRLIHRLGERLDVALGIGRTDAFWQTALGPWAILFTHSAAERRRRVLDLSKDPEPLRVLLLPRNCPFGFADTLDFMVRGVLASGWNYYLFSRMVEALAPPHWEISYAPPRELTPGSPLVEPENIKSKLRRFLRNLPFPYHKGFSLGRNLRLNIAVLRNKTAKPDREYDLNRYGAGGIAWGFDFFELAERALPRSFESEIPQRLPRLRGRLRGITAAAGQDDRYRLRIASLVEVGASLFSVQHGANYGNLASIGGSFWEYARHAFISWGWKMHPPFPVNAVPLPQPGLAAVYNTHNEAAPSLILVGTEMSSRLYRLKSRPQSGELPAYRQAKVDFFQALDEPVRKASFYRPYFRTPGGLQDGDHLRRALPDIPLCRGDLGKHMSSCRVLVLDHYGTTMHQALAAGTPLVAFWNRASWGMTPETDAVLNELAAVGILHPDAASAALHINRVWDNIPDWWTADAVQAARKRWLAAFALCGEGPDLAPVSPARLAGLWAETLRTL